MAKKHDAGLLKIDGRKLTHEQSEYIRIQAVTAVRKENRSPEEVIKTFGLHRANIYRWLKQYDKGGVNVLKSRKAPGPLPKLTNNQKRLLYKILLKDPLQLKFEFALWTIEMIAELIERKFGVRYTKVHVGRILDEIGFSKQKPLERAYQQDPEKVQEWLTNTFPAIKREAKKEKRTIYFSDEAGFHATVQYGTTWAPKGKTPVIKASGQRQKVNCISAISNKGEMRFMLYESKFTADTFIEFLKRMLHKQTNPITLIVDGHRTHFTKKVKEFAAATNGKLKIYQLPSYSPELNPDEFVWNNAKQKVAKRKYKQDKTSFKEKVRQTMSEIKKDKGLVMAFFL